jgi:hypothetical protein
MLMTITLFKQKKVDPETLFALRWKKPQNIDVYIERSGSRYFAKGH